MKQRIYGVILLFVGIAEMILLPEDATGGFMVCLMALCLIFSRNIMSEKR